MAKKQQSSDDVSLQGMTSAAEDPVPDFAAEERGPELAVEQRVTSYHLPEHSRRLQQQKAVEIRLKKKMHKDRDFLHLLSELATLRQSNEELHARVAALEDRNG